MRRLQNFSAVDASGSTAPLEGLEFAGGQLSLSGAVYPASGQLEKEAGRRVEEFGPVTGWGVEALEGPEEVLMDLPPGKNAGAFFANR